MTLLVGFDAAWTTGNSGAIAGSTRPRRMSDRTRSRGLIEKSRIRLLEQVVLTGPHLTVRV